MVTLTAMLRVVVSTIGSNQLGFLTMSSKVLPGEKKTPRTRANGPRDARASGAAAGFDDAAGIHSGDTPGHLGPDPRIVDYLSQPHFQPPAQTIQQIPHPFLHHYPQPRDRLP